MRMRVVSYTVQPRIMVDDGENLTEVQVNPVTVAAADWPNVVASIGAGVDQLRQQLEAAPQPQPPAAG